MLALLLLRAFQSSLPTGQITYVAKMMLKPPRSWTSQIWNGNVPETNDSSLLLQTGASGTSTPNMNTHLIGTPSAAFSLNVLFVVLNVPSAEYHRSLFCHSERQSWRVLISDHELLLEWSCVAEAVLQNNNCHQSVWWLQKLILRHSFSTSILRWCRATKLSWISAWNQI